jgi:hypothetical protein
LSRIVVVGGRGFFGAAAVGLLREAGQTPVVGSRRADAAERFDAENPAQLRSSLQNGDIVIDAAGPFQARSTALVEMAIEKGCDVIDLADSLDYVSKVRALGPVIDRSGSRVLTACSSVSAVSAALVRLLGVERPTRLSAFLAPATRNTSTAGTAASLMANLGHPARILRAGALVERLPFSERRSFDFGAPVGRIDGRLGESPDVLTLPLVWPSLRDVDFWVDSRRRWLNATLALAARSTAVRRFVRAASSLGRRVAKQVGARSGGYAVEVEDEVGSIASAGFVQATHSYVVAVAPAVLAALALRRGTFGGIGCVPPDRMVDPGELVTFLKSKGVGFFVRHAV